MSKENFEKFLKELGESISLPDISADEENYCCLSFDDRIVIHLQYSEDADILMLFAQLGTISEEKQGELYPKILKANLFWQGTGGATIGVDDETKEVLMCYQIPMSVLPEYSDFQDLMEGFINTAEVWIGTLEAVDSSASKTLK